MGTNPLNVAQGFHPKDVLRLEVERDPVGGELLNLLPNVAGPGAWGWLTPVNNTVMTETGGVFTFTNNAAQNAYFTTDYFALPGAGAISAAWEVTASGVIHRARFEWFNVDKALISRSDMTGYMDTTTTTRYTTSTVPSGAVYARIRFDVYGDRKGSPTLAGRSLAFRDPRVVLGAPITVRTNLVPGSSFEDATDVDLFVALGLGVGAALPGMGRVLDSGAVGSYVLQVANPSNPNGPTGFDIFPVNLALPANLSSTAIDIEVGGVYTFGVYTKAVTTSRSVSVWLRWVDATGTDIGSLVTLGTSPNSSVAWQRRTFIATAPANARYVYFGATVNTTVVGDQHRFDGWLIERGDTRALPHIDGTQLTSGSLPPTPNAYYTTLAGEVDSYTINRSEPLAPGTLTVRLAPNNTLDPATNTLLKPGRRCRLSVAPNLATPTTWQPLFTGTMGPPETSYDLLRPGDQAISGFTATDPAGRLAGTPQAVGVGTVAALPAVLETSTVPWNVNGSTNGVATFTTAATDTSASALDQVVRTRDTVLGYAWIDRAGVLQVRDPGSISSTVADTLDETVYNPNIVVDYDLEDVINTVRVLLKDPAGGSDSTFGAYIDPDSVRRNTPMPATFTVQGIAGSAIPAYARQILAASATPARRVRTVVIPITTANLPRTTRDLYDLVRVVNTRAGIDTNMRITGVEHTITGSSWLMTLTLTVAGRVAIPTTSS